MDHLALAGVNSDVRDRASAASAKEHEIAWSDPTLRLPGQELFHRGARYLNASLGVGVLHQPAAIHSAGRSPAQHVGGADQSFGGAEDLLARGAMRVAVRSGCRRRRAAPQSDQSR